MVDKIEVGKRYKINLNLITEQTTKDKIVSYTDNGIILISEIDSYGRGLYKFDEHYHWYFSKNYLISLREEAFLEIFKEELGL